MVQYWSNSPVRVAENDYSDLLVGVPSVRTPLPEFLAGIERPSASRFAVSNANKEITNLKKLGLLRGKRAIIQERLFINHTAPEESTDTTSFGQQFPIIFGGEESTTITPAGGEASKFGSQFPILFGGLREFEEVNNWYNGIVDSTAIHTEADFELQIQDLNILRRDFPTEIVDTNKFPNVIDDDAGRAVNYCIGTSKKVPLACIKSQESPSVQYQYLVGRGDLAVDVVYRDGLVIQSYPSTADGAVQAATSTTLDLAAGEQKDDDFYNDAFVLITGGTGSGQVRKVTDYVNSTNRITVDSAWTTTPDGTSTYVIREWKKITVTVNSVDYTAIEFAIPQKFNEQILTSRRMAADVTGLQTERNPAKALETMLGFFTTKISASDFTSAETEINNIGNLFVDGAMTEQRPALEWIDQICKIGRMVLRFDSDRNFKPVVIGTQNTVYGTFRDDRNVVSISPTEEVPWSDLVGELTVRYRKQFDNGNYRITSGTHTVVSGAQGKEQLDFDLIFNKTTADKVADFLAKAKRAQDEVLPVKLGYEARQRQNLDLIQFHDTSLNRKNIYQIIETEPVGNGFNFKVIKYPDYLTTYETGDPAPGSITDPVTDSTADFRKTPASTVSSLAVSWTVTSLNVSAKASLSWTNPAENFDEVLVEYKKSTDSTFTSAGKTSAEEIDIPGLEPGINYDFRLESISQLSEKEGGVATLSNQTAAGDSSAPANPTNFQVDKRSFADITWSYDLPTEDDYEATEYQLSTSASEAGKIDEDEVRGGKVKLTLQDSGSLNSSVTRYLRIRHRDHSGNPSSWSSWVAGTTKNIVTNDIGENEISQEKNAILSSSTSITVSGQTIIADTISNSNGKPITVTVEFTTKNNSSSAFSGAIPVQIRRGSTTIHSWTISRLGADTSANDGNTYVDTNPGTGNVTYTIRFDPGFGAPNRSMHSRALRLRQLKDA